MTPWVGFLVLRCGYITHFVYTEAWNRVIKYKNNDDNGSVYQDRIVHFMNPLTGDLMLGCGHVSHYNDYGISCTLSIYSTLIAIV